MSFQRAIKDYLLIAEKNFNLNQSNFSNLLGVDPQKMNSILNDEPCILEEEEETLLLHRSLFLSNALSSLSPQERIKPIIKTELIEKCKLSLDSLAKYASVPVETLDNFLNTDNKIEDKHLINICFNLYMLFTILFTDNKATRE